MDDYRTLALKNYGLKCDNCGLKDPRVLEIHHKNKNHNDNNIKNLQVLCCNCHRLQHISKESFIVSSKTVYNTPVNIQIKQKGSKSKAFTIYSTNMSLDYIIDIIQLELKKLWREKNRSINLDNTINMNIDFIQVQVKRDSEKSKCISFIPLNFSLEEIYYKLTEILKKNWKYEHEGDKK